MSTETALVSAPVEGIPVFVDFVPSIVFGVLYALLLPGIVYNFFISKPRAWNTIQIQSIGFAAERIAWCIIRVIQATHPERRSWLMNYVQMIVGLGFVGISSGVVKLLWSTLVNTTLPEKGASKDRPVTRRRYRLLCFIFELSFLASTVPGLIAGGKYRAARNNQDLADKNMRLLYASTGVVFALELVTIVSSLAAIIWVKGVNRKRCLELAALTALIMTVPIYRLCVLHIRTDDVFDPIPSLARAAFYVVHLLPEWLCVCVLLGTNVSSRFNTGRWGDYELTDRSRNKSLGRAQRESKGCLNQPLEA
ncbi:hypothetical protein BDV93DRAFT_542926 [Ceratobasidium sp. AG-I]|nr:hypothetical protein BDV93DRAFT_542926 [Ceratobasidium sp. AG-I]